MRPNVRVMALVAMVALAACGDNDGVTPGTLSQEQAAELASAIFSQSFFGALEIGYEQPPQAVGGPMLATYSETVEATGPCPLGGEVAINGSVDVETDDETGAGDIDFTLTLVHSSCAVQGQQGTQFTLTGNPSLVFDFLMSTDGEQGFSFSGSISGAVDYAIDGGDEGSCPINYDFSGESSQTGFAAQATGSVCGVDVSQNVSGST